MALIINSERIQTSLSRYLETNERLLEAGYCMALAGLAFWKTKYYFVGLTDKALVLVQVTATQKVVANERIELNTITNMSVSKSGTTPGARELEFELNDGRKYCLTFNIILGMHNPDCSQNIAVHLYEETKEGRLNIRFPGTQ